MKVHQPTVRVKETDSVRRKVPLSQSAATFLHLSTPSQGGLHLLDEYTSQTTNNTTLIGQDLWKQLKRVTIPVFSGDKRTSNPKQPSCKKKCAALRKAMVKKDVKSKVAAKKWL